MASAALQPGHLLVLVRPPVRRTATGDAGLLFKPAAVCAAAGEVSCSGATARTTRAGETSLLKCVRKTERGNGLHWRVSGQTSLEGS